MKIEKYRFEELEEEIQQKESIETNIKENQDKENIEEKLKEIIEKTERQAKEQAEIIKEKAKKDGFEAGYKEGFESGTKQIQKQFEEIIQQYSKKMEEVIKRLIATANNINQQYKELESNATDAVLSIASKVIAKKIEEDKDAIASMIKEALNLTENKKIKIRLHPENAKNITEHIEDISGNKVIEIIEDNNLSKGAVMLEEEDGNIIDAGVDAKLEQIKNRIKNE